MRASSSFTCSLPRELQLQELPWLNIERFGKLLDIVDRDVARLSLDVADVSAIETALVCKHLLRPTQLLSQPNQIERKYFTGSLLRARHARKSLGR